MTQHTVLTNKVVTEREACERERAAWRKGFLKAADDARACVREKAMYGGFLWDGDRGVPVMDAEFYNIEPDYLYPLPHPEPKVVTGVSGNTYRFTDKCVWMQPYNGNTETWRQVAPEKHGTIPVEDAPTVATLMEGK